MKTVVFQHIPKTAGSTIISILEKEYPEKLRYKIDPMKTLESLNLFQSLERSKRDRYQLIYRHLSEQLIKSLSNQVIVFSFLRDPVDLFLSSYFYIKRATWNRNHKAVKDLGSVEEYLDFCLENNLLNPQTRYMSGKIDYLFSENNPSKPVDKEMFDLATSKLANLDYVFRLENFVEAILLIAEKLNWKKIPYYRVQNKTKSRMRVDEISLDLKGKLYQYLSHDMALYERPGNIEDGYEKRSSTEVKKFHLINNFRNLSRLNRS